MSLAPVLDVEPRPILSDSSRRQFDYRRMVRIVSGIILALVLLLMLRQEQFEPVTVGMAILALAAWVWSTTKFSRIVTVSVALNVALIFLYTWSLGESINFSIQVTPTGYVANVEGNRLALSGVATKAGPSLGSLRTGLFASAANHYKATPLGAAEEPPHHNLFTWIADTFRFASPGPAWRDLRLRPHGAQASTLSRAGLVAARGTWSVNPRGEISGSLGASGYFSSRPTPPYQLSGYLMRADGIQGLLINVNPEGRGYLFTISLDRRYLRWFAWNNGKGTLLAERPVLSLGTEPMIQRLLRFTLPSAILALLLLTGAVAVYLLMLPVSSLVERLAGDVSRRAKIRPKFGRIGVDLMAACISLTSLAAASWVAVAVYRGVPNVVDGITNLFQARTLALGKVWAPAPSIPAFFTEQYVLVHQGHWIGKYPPGWPFVLSIGVLFNTPWIVGPIMGAVGLFILYLIGREVYGRKVALVATVLGLTSPFLLFVNGSFFPHAATWVFLGGFVYLLLRWFRAASASESKLSKSWKTDSLLLVPAGLLLGLAFATRQLDAIAFSLPFVALLLRRPRGLFFLCMGGAVPASLWLLYNDLVTGNFLGNAYTFFSPRDRLGFGDVGGASGSYASNFTFARTLWNAATEIEHLQASLFGWPYFFALALVALPFLLGRANRWDFLFVAANLSLVAAYMFYWADGVAWGNFPRYWYVAVPVLALLSARGLQELYRFPLSSALRLPARPVTALAWPAALMVLLLTFNLADFLPKTTALMARWNSRNLDALQTVQRSRVHNAVVFQVQGASYWWPYGGVFQQNSPLLNGDIVWARDRGPADKALMRVFPGRTYYRLDGDELTRLYG